MMKNPFASRLNAFAEELAIKELDVAILENQFNIRALTGLDCDNARLIVNPLTTRDKDAKVTFYTDFRYSVAMSREAPFLTIRDIKNLDGRKPIASSRKKIRTVGYEETISHRDFLTLEKVFPDAKFIDISNKLAMLRAVKTPEEQSRIRDAAKLNDEIWNDAKKCFRAGMTEREMARIIQKMMIERGDGEAFATIVCVGKNAAECHHVPDETVWNGRDSVLVDMGVKLNGFCSDLTRNILPKRPSRLYKKVYDLVREANARAFAAARPGMTASDLDKVARDFLAKNGFGKAFGHSLGHGVGLEIHEAPFVSRKRKMVLQPGMIFTIEPGVYLPDNLGVRIEDLAIMTPAGCESLSRAEK